VALLTSAVNGLFWVNRIVDTCFTIDMIVQLNLEYCEGNMYEGNWVTNRWLIATKYFKSWFLVRRLLLLWSYGVCSFVLFAVFAPTRI